MVGARSSFMGAKPLVLCFAEALLLVHNWTRNALSPSGEAAHDLTLPFLTEGSPTLLLLQVADKFGKRLSSMLSGQTQSAGQALVPACAFYPACCSCKFTSMSWQFLAFTGFCASYSLHYLLIQAIF